jgi:hypothetical protein
MSTQISLDVDMLADMPAKTMLVLVAKYRETKKFFEQAQRTLQDFPALFLFLEEMDIEPRFDPDIKLITLNFAGDGPKLGKVWGELRRAGYTSDTRPKKGDTQFSGWFTKDNYVAIAVYFTSTLCRRIKVGTKTVEQDIYETICGEDMAVAAPTEAPALVNNNAVIDSDIPF